MKNPNGYGCITKLSGKRRRPYAIRVTVGFNEKGTQKYKYLSYHATRKEAIIALAEFNKTPFDLDAASITFAKLYERYIEENSKNFGLTVEKKLATYFNHSQKLHKVIFKDLRRVHLQGVIDELETPTAKEKVSGFFKRLYKYAVDNDIVHKDYSQALVTPAKEKQTEKQIFTESEIKTLWENSGVDNVDILLILLYSGMRISELLNLTKEQIYLDESHFIAGSKTEAGRDRYIPIHPKIKPLVEHHYNAHDGEYLFMSLTKKAIRYDSFAAKRFKPLMKDLNMKHTIHETRHTFITKMHAAGADPLALKRIVGHSSSDTTEHYTHIQAEALHFAVNLID